jgi:ribose transport system permease protein
MTDPAAKLVRGRHARRGRSVEVWLALGALAIVLGFGAIYNADGAFFLPATHADALWQIAGFGIIACGMTIVILTGGIDLSVGSVAGLSGVVVALLATKWHVGGGAAIAGAVAAGAACGVLSGVLIAALRLQPFIATLAMMAFARGLAKWLTGGVKVQMFEPPAAVAMLDAKFFVGEIGVPWCVVVFLGCAAATVGFLRLTSAGMQVYAVGDNEQAARYAGVPVVRTKVLAYTACGALAGLAGVLFAAVGRQGNPDGGAGYELTAIAMVVIGGTTLAGGRGGILLTVLGALTIGYLRKILDINGVETANQLMITGGIIVVAVLGQGWRRR